MDSRAQEHASFIDEAQKPPRLSQIEYFPNHVRRGDVLPTWKPRILRWPALISIFLSTLAIIGLLEVAARKLPATASKVSWTASRTSRPDPRKRWATAAVPIISQLYERSASGASFMQSSTAFHTPALPSSATGAYIEPETAVYTVSRTYLMTGGYIEPETAVYTVSPASVTLSAASDDYIEPATTFYSPTAIPISMATEGYLSPDTTFYTPTSGPITSMMAGTDAYLEDQITTLYPPSRVMQPGAHLQPETSSYTPTTITHAQPSTYLTTTYTQLTGAAPPGAYMAPKFTNPAPSITPMPLGSAAPGAYMAPTYTNPAPSVALITFAPTVPQSGQLRPILSTKVLTFYPLRNSQNPKYNQDLYPQAEDNGVTMIYKTVTIYPWYGSVLSALVPVLVITIYRNIWSIFYAGIKLIEPFALLFRPGGALGKDVLFWYFTSAASLNPARSLIRGHWTLLWSSVIYLISGFFAPFASEALTTNTHHCPDPSTDPKHKMNPCFGQLMVDLKAVRALQGLLFFVAMVTIGIGAMLFRRQRTGVFNDPSCIAGIACLTHHPAFINEILDIDGDATDQEVEKRLGGKRYRLGMYENEQGVYRYGFMPVFSTGFDLHPATDDDWNVGLKDGARQYRPDLVSLELIYDAVFGVLIVGLFGVILAYYLEAGDTPFNRFFNSDSFGPRFILTLFGGLVAAVWRSFYADVAGKNVFAALAKGGCDAKHSICARRPATPVTGLLPAIAGRRWFEATVAAVAILSEVLIIALPGIPFTSGERRIQFFICSYLALAILGLMALTVPCLMFWRVMVVPYLPRRVDQIQGIVSYIAGSGLLRDCEELESAGTEERDAALGNMGKRWSYARFDEKSGGHRWMIDEDIGTRNDYARRLNPYDTPR